ncbi:MAG TPA: hypothetical protein VII76_07150 [Acidimicrobiales bacterium]
MSLASPTRLRISAPKPGAAVFLGLLLAGASAVVASQPVSASAKVISVANATVVCTQVAGLERFDPHLRTRGTVSGLETVHLSLTLNGCSSPVLPPPITITGQLKGALVANTGTSCATTLGTSSYTSVGTLTVSWKTHKAKIAPLTSFAPQRVKLGRVQRKSHTNQTLKLGGPGSPRPSVIGDFTGGNGGKSSSFTLSWRRSSVTCSVGLNELPIVAGSLSFS